MQRKRLQHTPKTLENLFGVEDSILTRFGPQAFKKSTDDLIIKYSQDLLGDKFLWNSSNMKKKVKELDKVKDDFDAKQKGRPSDQPASLESDVIPGDQLPSLWHQMLGSMLL